MMDENKISDRELDRLLSAASTPRAPDGFNDRLLAKLLAEPGSLEQTVEADVIAFPARRLLQKQSSWPRLWPAAFALAAALAAGIYLGAANNVPSFVSGNGAVASIDDSDLTGFEELDTMFQDGQS